MIHRVLPVDRRWVILPLIVVGGRFLGFTLAFFLLLLEVTFMVKQILGKLPRKTSLENPSSGEPAASATSNSNNDNADVGWSSASSAHPSQGPNSDSVTNNSSKAISPLLRKPLELQSGAAVATNVFNEAREAAAESAGQAMCADGNACGLPSSLSNSVVVYEPLPSLHDVPSSEKHSLFLKKLSMCCVTFDFTEPSTNLKEKDVKRRTLLELVDCITSMAVRLSDVAMQEITKMVAANLFRAFPPSNHCNKILDVYEPEEQELAMEPAWPHLQIVYEFLLRFVASPEMDAKLAKRYVDHSFLLRFLDLFNSKDQREREYLKAILHRVYGKFMVHRPFIRKAINNIFYHFIFETENHNGIAELLEILGSIINGFSLPLKEEHKLFLVRALIPLHKPRCMATYHQQLSYCIIQFVKKDIKLADTVIMGLLKYWPITSSSKELMFLGELQEVLEVTQIAEFQDCMVPLFRRIARCLNSSHFQVAERALFLWNNDHIWSLINQNRKVILPIIFPALERNAKSHWNQAIQSLTLNVRKYFLDADQEHFENCLVRFQEDEVKGRETCKKRESIWLQLEVAASKIANGRGNELCFSLTLAKSPSG